VLTRKTLLETAVCGVQTEMSFRIISVPLPDTEKEELKGEKEQLIKHCHHFLINYTPKCFTKPSNGGKQKRPFYFRSAFLWHSQDKAYHVSCTVNEGLMLHKNSPIVPGRMRVKHNSFSSALSLVNKVSRQESADCLGWRGGKRENTLFFNTKFRHTAAAFQTRLHCTVPEINWTQTI